jgi:predicted  nucleic acid-binding Zn-ribbon protein
LLRRHSIQVLTTVASALEAAARQRQSLLDEIHTAERALRDLTTRRELAETSLAATQAHLAAAASQLHAAQTQRVAVLRELEHLLTASLAARSAAEQEVAALHEEIAALHRDAGSLQQARAAQQQAHAALQQAHAALQQEHAALQQEHAALQQEHAALQEEHAALQADLAESEPSLRAAAEPDARLSAVPSRSLAPTMPVGTLVAVQHVTATELTLPATTSAVVVRAALLLPYLGSLMIRLGSPVARLATSVVVAFGLRLVSAKRSIRPASRPTTQANAHREYDRDTPALLGH